MMFLLAMTDAERGAAFGTGIVRLVACGVGVWFLVSKARGKSTSNTEDYEDPKDAPNNDPSRSGRPRF